MIKSWYEIKFSKIDSNTNPFLFSSHLSVEKVEVIFRTIVAFPSRLSLLMKFFTISCLISRGGNNTFSISISGVSTKLFHTSRNILYIPTNCNRLQIDLKYLTVKWKMQNKWQILFQINSRCTLKCHYM